MQNYDVIIIGAGAAGLFCASQAGQRGQKVLLIDHANRVGKKILMSGGGRCNFTNLHITYDDYYSSNPHFFKSALSQYTQWDFIKLVEDHGIAYHEKGRGELFCDNKASDIVQMLVTEVQKVAGEIRTHCEVQAIAQVESGYSLKTSLGTFSCQSLVIATGGLSIPTMGATGFGYEVAKQFGHTVLPTKPALVPFVWDDRRKINKVLSGVSCDAEVTCNDHSYQEGLLFTHRGLSGPAILKASSHWDYGVPVEINFLPSLDLIEALKRARTEQPRKQLKNWLQSNLVNQLVEWLLAQLPEHVMTINMADMNNADIEAVNKTFCHWHWVPADTEGYRTAEVTMGGVDVTQVSSKTMESALAPNLYFIGEVLDVTGQLGGFNFQWAWSSAYAAAQAL
ncbi:MAG: NAD(P)/FAD-dependent oxidoreductase [Gammaproteobacteria bacterium]|nr:NAD(P)/FAD-dependent oxidoreductase [Gammaproteobacteria bacterium]NNJ72819.1 NAD(P)/FAD-dependent oxidoreductase [Enterobacterales bacterium]